MWSISREELCCKKDGGKPLNSRYPEYKARDYNFFLIYTIAQSRTTKWIVIKSDILGLFRFWSKLGENKEYFTQRPKFVSLPISNATT
jgi:hypothetical protein